MKDESVKLLMIWQSILIKKKNKLDIQVIRFHSIIRIIFSSKKIIDRPQRDFLEKSKSNQRQKFIKFLKKNGIFFLEMV